jgi:hypothetical protein
VPDARRPRPDAVAPRAPAPERIEATERLLVPLAASVVVASVALAAWVLHVGSGSGVVASLPAAAPVRPLFRDPKAMTFAVQASDIVLGVAVRPGGPIDLLPRTGAGAPLVREAVRATVAGEPVAPTSCGPGCLRLARPALAGKAIRIEVTIPRPGRPAADAAFRLPARLPPKGDSLLRQVNRTMGALRTLRYRQRLSAGRGSAVEARYTIQAPDRITFETSSGARVVIVGPNRWDWQGDRWVKAGFPNPGVRLPAYPWEGAGGPRLLGRAIVRGVPVRVLALVNPDGGPAWFRLFVEPGGRVVSLEMLAPGHFMSETYTGFDEPLTIRPPR